MMLNILSSLSIVSALLVINSTNPIVSVLLLISLFINVAGYLILNGLTFIGLTYLMVYVGAIAILFIFVIMLLNINKAELVSSTSESLPIGLLLGLTFLSSIYFLIPTTLLESEQLYYSIYNIFISDKIEHLPLLYSVSWDTNLLTVNQLMSLGLVMYNSHSIFLLIISFILLLSIMGAIVITKRDYTIN
jgi:NADH-ubiquinone oxidoreductase chain 6